MRSIPSLVLAALFTVSLSLSAIAGCGGGAGGDCSKDDPCSKGEACVFGAGSCQAGARGTCVGVFQCDGPATGPVCGCDGKTVEGEYGECGVSTYDTPAACQVGTFACGPTLQCKRNSDVCVATVSGMPASTSYTCEAFAKVKMDGWCVNGIPFCECINQAAFGASASASCKADADNQETITVTTP